MTREGEDRRRERLIENEGIYRRANDLIDAGRDDQLRGRKEGFLCECSNEDCSETVELTWDEYRSIRDNADCFVIRPAHETAGIDRVVEQRDGYVIVAKKLEHSHR